MDSSPNVWHGEHASDGKFPMNIISQRDSAPASMTKEDAGLWKADFRYSPAWWQTLICLPDDRQKTIVSKEGALLYEYLGDFYKFGTRVSISAADELGITSRQQYMSDPRVPIVETVIFDGEERELIRWDSFAVIPGQGRKLPVFSGNKGMTTPRENNIRAQGDLIVVKKSSEEDAIRITIDSLSVLRIKNRNKKGICRSGRRFLTVSSAWKSAEQMENCLVLTFSKDVRELAVYCSLGQEAGDVSLEWAKAQKTRAVSYWSSVDFPYNAIRVPDPIIQALIESSIRNIYQAREFHDKLPVFQVGPTCYRGIWVIDGAFIFEAMTFLGRGMEARSGIKYLLSKQKPDGSFEILNNFWKENGIVLYILYRHTLLTQDYTWLKENWHVVRKIVQVIKTLRERSMATPQSPEAGLMPPGFPDGGIDGCVPEYTNVYWNLIGLRAAVESARLIQSPELDDWESEYNDFMRVFKKAVKRDVKPFGKKLFYLPILMKERKEVNPVRGQWAFCHAVYPGGIFDIKDRFVLGNMALLDSRQSEGIVLGTGWMTDGIWSYFASFYGHAHLWIGNGKKASEILYAFANHACPMLVWREEQSLNCGDDKFWGDMPHNWASAEFIRLTRNILILERGSELHLLEGIPRTWLNPGAETALNGVSTNFGRVSMKLTVSPDGDRANLTVIVPENNVLKRIVVHLGAWAGEGKPEVIHRKNAFEMKIPLLQGGKHDL